MCSTQIINGSYNGVYATVGFVGLGKFLSNHVAVKKQIETDRNVDVSTAKVFVSTMQVGFVGRSLAATSCP